jgi:phospholipase/lecithinase/hemolysin
MNILSRTCRGISCLLSITATTPLIAPDIASAEITRIVAFGDSLTDVGNLHHASDGAVGGPPNWEGRFSNGPVWVEYLADYISVPRPAASRLGGTNAAVGGASTGHGAFVETRNNPPPNLEIPRVGRQIEEILANHSLSESDLIVVWAGFNDVQISFPGGQLTPEQIVTNLTDHITTLHAAGGSNFLVGSLTGAETVFNALWPTRIDELRRTLPIDLYYLDVASLFSRVGSDPAAFGFVDDFTPIIGRSVANPDEYAVWDEHSHPTTALHRVIADAALEAVWRLDGDYNDNGVVEQGDLDLVLVNWSGRGRPVPAGWLADLPNRFVDQGELDRVLMNWGDLRLVPRAQPAGVAIPEPSSFILLLCASAIRIGSFVRSHAARAQ